MNVWPGFASSVCPFGFLVFLSLNLNPPRHKRVSVTASLRPLNIEHNPRHSFAEENRHNMLLGGECFLHLCTSLQLLGTEDNGSN